MSRLHKAATEGRIAAEELEQRVAHALKAQTYGDLETTVSDLPGPRPRSRRPPARRTPVGWAVAAVRANPMLILFAIPVVAVTLAMMLAAAIIWMVLMVVVMVLGGGRRGPMDRAAPGCTRAADAASARLPGRAAQLLGLSAAQLLGLSAAQLAAA